MFDYGFKKLGVDTQGAQERPAEEPIFAPGDPVTINIDGNYEMQFPDQQPVIIDGRAMVPIRALMETLEKSVDWNGEARETIISDDTVTLRLKTGSSVMVKETRNPLDGSVRTEELPLDAAPVIVNGRTCLPVRAVAEAFGMAVIWEQETQTILIIAGVC